MFRSLKQLFADLQDKSAGEKISNWSIKIPLVLWTKFFAILVLIVIMTIIYSLVYYVPQLPKILDNSVPEMTVSLDNNQLKFSPEQPLKMTSPEGSLIIDTRDNPDDYTTYPNGLFVYKDFFEIKNNNGEMQKMNYKEFKPFFISKSQVIDYLNANKSKIVWVLVPLVLVGGVLVSSFVWGMRVLGFYGWTIIFWLIFKIMKRPLEFKQILPVVIYAAILPLLISYVLFFAPHPLLNLLNTALFIFFTISWLIPLTTKEKLLSVKKITKKK